MGVRADPSERRAGSHTRMRSRCLGYRRRIPSRPPHSDNAHTVSRTWIASFSSHRIRDFHLLYGAIPSWVLDFCRCDAKKIPLLFMPRATCGDISEDHSPAAERPEVPNGLTVGVRRVTLLQGKTNSPNGCGEWFPDGVLSISLWYGSRWCFPAVILGTRPLPHARSLWMWRRRRA